MQRIQKNIIMYYNHCKNNIFNNNENKESIQYIIVINTQCHTIHKS